MHIVGKAQQQETTDVAKEEPDVEEQDVDDEREKEPMKQQIEQLQAFLQNVIANEDFEQDKTALSPK